MECWLIDDGYEEHVIFGLALKLTGLAITCRYHFFADEALQALQEGKGQLPAVIFLDINMPRLNGFYFLKQVKADERLAQIPVYMYSTGTNADHQQQAELLHATGFITKANSYRELSEVIRKTLIPYVQREK